MHTVLEKIRKIGIVPVVVLEDENAAKPLAQALCNGGLPCAEITFRTEAAEDAIRILKKDFPDILVGAGTVLTTKQAEKAVAAGAEFLVSPGLNPGIVQYCVERDILMIPGCSNASDIEIALEYGLEAVKFFPAEPAGGLSMLKALSEPYAGMKFMPTGGIHSGNVSDYLAYDCILACGGSWMVKKELIRAGNFTEIERLVREAAELVKKARERTK